MSPAPPALTVLIADDDGPVRRFVSLLLRKAGYNVITATNGAKARVLLQGPGQPVALAICDIHMPYANGLDLAVSLQVQHPNIPVLFISGLVDSIAVQSIKLRDPAAILTKPFRAEELIERVNALTAAAQAKRNEQQSLAGDSETSHPAKRPAISQKSPEAPVRKLAG